MAQKKPKRGRGRPCQLTPEITAKVVQAISGGNYRQVAAQWAGVSARTFHEWVAKGKRQSSGIYVDFLQAILEAERAAEIRMVALVMKAAAEDPRHAEWWLERKCHDRWGRKDRKEITGAKGGPLRVDAVRGMVEDPELIALMKAKRGWRPDVATEGAKEQQADAGNQQGRGEANPG